MNLAPSTRPAAKPEAEGGSPKSANFSITTAEGVVLEFSVNQSGNTMNIKPVTEAAWGAVDKLDKKLVTATGLLAGQEKLGLSAAHISAVMIYEKK